MFSFPNISSFFKRGAPDTESPAPQNREEQSPVEEVARSVEEASEAALQIQAAPSDLTDREILQLENDLAMQMLKQYNSFESEEEKRAALQMASLAGLMYQNIDNLERVQPFFDTTLELLPTPDQMGIKLPTGLAVQAFRDGSQIIIAMRGTELNQDSATMAANLIADMGIGRHKTNEDLIGSINAVRERVLDLYNYNIPPEQFNFLAALITSRAIGDDDKARMLSTAAKVGKDSAKSGALGGLGGMVLGASVLIVSAPAAAIAVPAAALIGTMSGLIKGVASNATEIITLADGYQTTANYIRKIDAYIMKLKEEGMIRDGDTLVTTGHSLAGYLSGVIGFMHAEKAYSFNGPGVRLEEVEHVVRNLGLERALNPQLDYRSICMEADFIGNLGARDGPLKLLRLEKTFLETFEGIPACVYNKPLSHHGIKLIQGVLQHVPVCPQENIIYLAGRN